MLRDEVREGRGKAIPEGRDRIQSELLAGAMGMLLAGKAGIEIAQLHGMGRLPGWFWWSCGFSAAFALVVWLLRAATKPAAAMGGVICVNVLLRQGLGAGWEQTAMPALLALFVLTFTATRFGRRRKEAMGTAEARRGRRAAQVVANLGVAGLCAVGGMGRHGSAAVMAACIAALAEATADTVSSEMGQAMGGGTRWWNETLLVTTGRPVRAGTDGGVSVAGTAFGVAAAAVIVLLSPFAHGAGTVGVVAVAVFGAGCAGLLFDSLLGATVERRGWLGNDLVNFASTVFAAAAAYCAVKLL
jgi:uncharacterized protein (TIGR00297 family)